ncbi:MULTISPECIES: GGDEF domain-containing protein [unclassified Flavobacterium]|uniref:GGDEF domain-containing protein n=1 Tax=unclassified Flavobacterium TaxID=196869 RepID=UPI0009DD547D|nr:MULTISPECIES: GGDEF domain-containing protein [unclassified Flavobacterium]OUL64192.1 GGDEF domain-containing protein [Flavobacterium sp. AJR]
MKEYLKKTYKKLKEDVLAKAIYDILKSILIALITYFILDEIPKGTTFGGFLNKELTFNILQILITITFIIISTIFIQFLLNRKRFSTIKKDLHTDELTGIPNHRALGQDLKNTIEWAKAKKMPFSIILMDIDNFKNLNTEFGQLVADNILVKFGTLLKADNRLTDTIYRQHLKGDEFIFITKETILENAVKAANRKRENIAKTGIKIQNISQAFNITVCCGVVEFNSELDTEAIILERAFDAMKNAKNEPNKNATASLI